MIDYSLCDGDHDWDNATQICKICGITAQAVYAGRDREPTWEDVDNAYREGRTLGIEMGALTYKYRRRKKLVEVGYYLCLRHLGKSINERSEDES